MSEESIKISFCCTMDLKIELFIKIHLVYCFVSQKNQLNRMKPTRIQEGYLPLKVGLKSAIKSTCLSMIGQFFQGSN